MEIKIPVYKPYLGGKEKQYVNECLDSTWISSKGKFIKEFEEGFAKYTGVRYAASVCNGTVALHLAMLALGIGKDDEVIVPTLTYIASVNAITYTEAIPVFVDSVETTWQADPADIRKKITSRTKAIMAVHLYGHPCDLEAMRQICDEHGLFLIEDCAEAIGTTFNGKHVGLEGDISTFSFFGNKTITCGEGGMVVTNDETLYDRTVHFKGQGLAKHREYWHDVVGYNYRMTNIAAAIGLAQLEQVHTFLHQKQELAKKYKSQLSNLPVKFHEAAGNVFHSYWMFSILVADSTVREKLRDHLRTKGIETRPVFYPVHTMPIYSQKFQKHPVAEHIGWRGINLPSFPTITDAEIKTITDSIREFYNR